MTEKIKCPLCGAYGGYKCIPLLDRPALLKKLGALVEHLIKVECKIYHLTDLKERFKKEIAETQKEVDKAERPQND